MCVHVYVYVWVKERLRQTERERERERKKILKNGVWSTLFVHHLLIIILLKLVVWFGNSFILWIDSSTMKWRNFGPNGKHLQKVSEKHAKNDKNATITETPQGNFHSALSMEVRIF